MLVPILVFLLFSAAVFVFGQLLMRRQPEEVGNPIVKLTPSPIAVAFAGAIPMPKRTSDRMRRELVQAGYYGRHAFESFVGTRNAILLCWFLFIAFLLIANTGHSPLMILGVGGLGFVLFYGVPGVTLSTLAESRSKRIYRSLPDALDMLTMMLTGGLGLDRSLQRTSRELTGAHPDLAKELSIIHHQSGVGSFGKSIAAFAERMDDPEISGLSTLIQHSERLGSPISEALIEYSDGIRRTRRQRAEEAGNKRNVMLLFPVITLLAPPIYILLLGPAMLELRDFMNRENREGGAIQQSVATASLNPTNLRP